MHLTGVTIKILKLMAIKHLASKVLLVLGYGLTISTDSAIADLRWYPHIHPVYSPSRTGDPAPELSPSPRPAPIPQPAPSPTPIPSPAPRPTYNYNPATAPAPVSCINVDSRRGWQKVWLWSGATRITSINGGWSADSNSLPFVGALGHPPAAIPHLEMSGQSRYLGQIPYGALLVGDGQNIVWIPHPGYISNQLKLPLAFADLRINEADNSLWNNAGEIRVCFQ